MMIDSYVHGYTQRETQRLQDQAGTLADLLHHDTHYAPGSRVLEAGCGVGGQTAILAVNHPEVEFVCVDVSAESIDAARAMARSRKLTNVSFQVADIDALPFNDGHFDHVFFCFVLEHLADPVRAIAAVQRVLRPGGTVTAIEGDHGSTCFHPRSESAWRTIQCLIDLQSAAGGDALIGRRLYPLFVDAGLQDARVSPRMVYVDASRPALVDGFIHKTFIAMVEGVREQALSTPPRTSPPGHGMTEDDWNRGIADLRRTAQPDGTFCYTFFKAVGRRG